MAANVPIEGKIGKAAPTARSGSGSGPLTGPMEDDAPPAGSESMHDLMPPPHFDSASSTKAMLAARLAQRDAKDAAAENGQ
jgi:hypothetical protein